MEHSRLVLKGADKVLHDSPARRDDYRSITGSSTYPLQFCGRGWLEDKKVAEKLTMAEHDKTLRLLGWSGEVKKT